MKPHVLDAVVKAAATLRPGSGREAEGHVGRRMLVVSPL